MRVRISCEQRARESVTSLTLQQVAQLETRHTLVFLEEFYGTDLVDLPPLQRMSKTSIFEPLRVRLRSELI